MANDWRDWEPGRTGVSVAQLTDGQVVIAHIVGEPYREETAESSDALHVPVTFVEFPDDFTDMSGDDVTDDQEYNIINSSTAFYQALTSAFPEGRNIAEELIEITARQPTTEAYSREYEIEVAD